MPQIHMSTHTHSYHRHRKLLEIWGADQICAMGGGKCFNGYGHACMINNTSIHNNP